MPFANLKVPEGLLDAGQKQHMIETVTDLYAEVFGERARPNTLVLVDEVVEGGWGLGGNVLSAAMLNQSDAD